VVVSAEVPADSECTRILFVPGELLAELSGSFLDRAALTVRSAPSFSEALRLADGWSPHVIVLQSELDAEVLSTASCTRWGRPDPRRC
jgi:hypothetical protein